ncbi:hypothetical protein CEXT_153961 [Caerostris extrusa]|uniref:Uncharacterized protein n=1 Tax=Caerostris extrusa TaxID=172846 RepID=A0AAV4WP72_CAEEX|nr:hypothetical protein CEXT_153961 [Caerostris extrusa]
MLQKNKAFGDFENQIKYSSEIDPNHDSNSSENIEHQEKMRNVELFCWKERNQEEQSKQFLAHKINSNVLKIKCDENYIDLDKKAESEKIMGEIKMDLIKSEQLNDESSKTNQIDKNMCKNEGTDVFSKTNEQANCNTFIEGKTCKIEGDELINIKHCESSELKNDVICESKQENQNKAGNLDVKRFEKYENSVLNKIDVSKQDNHKIVLKREILNESDKSINFKDKYDKTVKIIEDQKKTIILGKVKTSYSENVFEKNTTFNRDQKVLLKNNELATQIDINKKKEISLEKKISKNKQIDPTRPTRSPVDYRAIACSIEAMMPLNIKIEKDTDSISCNTSVLDSDMKKLKNIGEKPKGTMNNNPLTINIPKIKSIVSEVVKKNLKLFKDKEIKQENTNTIHDYYEEEKEDLTNPGWNKIKGLSTDEERYQQVRDCWNSATIPNPNKNLTYLSFRKKHLDINGANAHQRKPHKRQATSNCNEQKAKRARTCTFTFDNKIESIKKEKEEKNKILQAEMYTKISHLNKLCYEEEMQLQSYVNSYRHNFHNNDLQLKNIRSHYQREVLSVANEYKRKASQCDAHYQSGINDLKRNRNEVFQFCSFYKGLHKNEQKDPTLLTNDQLLELEEIEDIYNQLDHCYK